MTVISEKNQSLLLLAASPILWAAHFLLCYITASIWCAKVAGPAGSIQPVRITILVYTVLALAGIATIGRVGYCRQAFGNAHLPHDEDTPEDRHRFLGYATLLLSLLSAVAVIFAALVVVFFGDCH